MLPQVKIVVFVGQDTSAVLPRVIHRCTDVPEFDDAKTILWRELFDANVGPDHR